jgi:hypothetical protein
LAKLEMARKSTLVGTAPAGWSATVDGSPCTTPCSLSWTPGTNHTIAVDSPQAGAAGVQYVFGNWCNLFDIDQLHAVHKWKY